MPSAVRRPLRPGAFSGRRPRAALLLGAFALLAACEGQTLYEGPVGPGPGPGPTPGTGRGDLIAIPGSGTIADMVVDPASQRVFLSNLTQHRLEVLNLADRTFGASIPVGSQPWGLSLNRTGDTLIVANSGGTNISFVPTAALQEDLAKRLDLPRVYLYEIDVDPETGGFELRHYSWADRPQYATQDAQGRLLYSAISTAASPIGTIRKAEWRPGWRTWDTSLLFADGLLSNTPPASHRGVTAADDDDFAIANVDSITLVFATEGPFGFFTGRAVIFDHVPGSLPGEPNRLIRTDTLPIFDAIFQAHERGSDILIYRGYLWNFPDANAVADTTFVVASEDRNRIAFGEMSGDRLGRIMMWGADVGALSRVDDIRNLLNDVSDRITSVALNANGSLGMAQGSRATYFFGPDLRLQGSTAAAAPRGSGAGFLPGSTGNRTFAFEPDANRTVRILETTHYRTLAQITVRDQIVGPFRVGPSRRPEAACPPDFRQGSPDCVVATVYGVTAGRQLLILDVLARDIP